MYVDEKIFKANSLSKEDLDYMKARPEKYELSKELM